MTFLAWAALYEGATDEVYLDLLIPRVMEDMVAQRGTRTATIPPAPAVKFGRGEVSRIAREACDARDAFHLLFIHADTGGRNIQDHLENRSLQYCEAIELLCKFPSIRCITIAPRHETEAWIHADPDAITAALGDRGTADSIGLPRDANAAERLVDPKIVLAKAIERARRKRHPIDVKQIFPAVAQRQSITALRRARSFVAFETSLSGALASLGCI